VSIRFATIDDIASIKILESTSNLSTWSAEQYIAALTDPAYSLIVLDGQGEIVAFLLARISPDEDNSGTIEIMNIAVLTELRKKGFGRLLIDEVVIKSGYRSGSVQLEVRARNATAVEFYKRIGFESVGRRKDYYINPNDDAVLMNRIF
jgi:ribosomal-protein-alanine N-acetyltransferase